MSAEPAFQPANLASARRVVLKVGSALLIDPVTGAPSRAWLETLCADIAAFRAGKRDIVIVTSGAVAAGRAVLGLHGKLSLPEKQAAAAAGQIRLMRAWEDALAQVGIPAAQALLTPDDTERRRRWLNARATLDTLLEHGAAPIINENDTVATQELRYGDNDRLAARVAQLVGAEILVLLTDIDGLHARDPRADPSAPFVPFVPRVTAEIEAMAGGANPGSGVGTGGMRTKIEAAKIAARAGCATAITAGLDPRPFARLLAGAKATWFAAEVAPRAAYKAWIAGAIAPAGALVLDKGAVAAVRAGKSLLAAGVAGVSGRFDKGETVRLVDGAGAEIARGVVRYDSAEAERIKGLRSEAIEAALGYTAGPVIVHVDDLAEL